MTMKISLPSIHEMFPEHLLHSPPDWRRAPTTPIPSPMPTPKGGTRCSFNVLWSDPASASLTSSTSLPYPLPPRSKAGSLSGEDNDEDKKHVCTVCNKGFNRPSSLRIHVNTHTGATPFRCPFPGCGRGFNVNSNMRRHYRNHTNLGAAPFVPRYPSSWRIFRPHPKLPVNEPEHVWHPPSSSSASTDNEEEDLRYKLRPEIPKEDRGLGSDGRYKVREFHRRQMSDVRDDYGYTSARCSHERNH